MTHKTEIARKVVFTIAFVFATASAALAAGENLETIYNPNAPDLAASGDMSQTILDYGRHEQLILGQPSRFDNGLLDDGQKGLN